MIALSKKWEYDGIAGIYIDLRLLICLQIRSNDQKRYFVNDPRSTVQIKLCQRNQNDH